MNKIRKCPFCGSKDVELIEAEELSWCRCMKCDADGPTSEDSDKAVEMWNSATDGDE